MPIRTESKYSKKDIFIHMKTTIDIPNKILAEVCKIRFKMDTDSVSKWTVNPFQVGHPIRLKLCHTYK